MERELQLQRDLFRISLEFALDTLLRIARRNLFTVETLLIRYDVQAYYMSIGHNFVHFDLFLGLELIENDQHEYDAAWFRLFQRVQIIRTQHMDLYNSNPVAAEDLLDHVDVGLREMWPQLE